MTVEWRYETFIRRAFSTQVRGILDRWGDPAEMADAAHFSNNYFDEVKVTTGYAMLTYNVYIKKNVEGITLQDLQRMSSIVTDVINATDLTAIAALIDEYVNNVERRYLPLPTN
ncbi:hypothetical protein ICA_02798 [Bacillus cereus BAG1O-3]|uniref:hypothetical protein n=1 Tax=Bacillus cereus group TaxID=86661 RepID=UPI000353F5BD|nr:MULTISPECIES: hypothetical protein [Bacillus cereus group]EPF11111.1 hypothetical protein ICA_02798 [Bacillus cereus BAG1O-3]MDR4413738.1 hypothetical protein [Bacillus thuringiensis]PGX81381.1 hypothetical protein COE45_16485 [Bacillus thuringiensis]HDR8062564.1 hypothetical protein [Bacillus cereus]